MMKAACGLKGHHNTSSIMLPFQGAGYGCAPLQGALPPAKIGWPCGIRDATIPQGWPFRPFALLAEGDKSQLRPPAEMPKDLTFEALLYIPAEAYERKTGKKYDYSPGFPIETYSNEQGWGE
ncbi:MAG: hypothetical protein H6559_00185 [Lewinellaceae bacterium]|nr:hypothetical protein [Lewinellaceae bacterium]